MSESQQPEDFVRELLEAGVLPPDAVKLVRRRYGLRLGEAIRLVERVGQTLAERR